MPSTVEVQAPLRKSSFLRSLTVENVHIFTRVCSARPDCEVPQCPELWKYKHRSKIVFCGPLRRRNVHVFTQRTGTTALTG